MRDFSISEEINTRCENASDLLNRLNSLLVDADGKISDAVELINKDGGLGYIDYTSLDNESREIQDWIDHYTVFKELTGQYSNDVDQAFYSKHEQALIDLSELKMEDITVDNTLGIQEDRIIASGGGNVETYKVDKASLSFEDLLNYDGVSELMKAQYEEYKKESEANNTKYSENLDKYLEEILSGGEIEYDTGIKKWVSLGLDVLPIVGDAKGVIQAIVGIDIVTGRKLSDAERLLNLISLIPLYGDGTRLAATAVEGVYKDVAKIYAKEFLQNASAMGTNFVISKATEGSDLPPWVWILMYQGGRIGIKGVTNNADTIKARINGVKSGSFLDEIRLESPDSYNSIMTRVQNLTKDKRGFMNCNGTEELVKIYNSNKNLREVATKLDKLGLTEDEKWNIRKILDSGDSETIDKFAGIVVKYQGDKNKVLEFADEELRKINESNEKLKNIKTDVEDLSLKTDGAVENSNTHNDKNGVNTTEGGTETERLIPGNPGIVTGGSSTKLGQNLFKSMGLSGSTKRTPYQAMHIIPKEFKSHPIIKKIGMNFDDSSNGIFLKNRKSGGISPMSRHEGNHKPLNDFVESKLDNMDINKSIPELEQEVFDLQQKCKKLMEEGLPMYAKENERTDKFGDIMRANKGENYGEYTIDLWERWFNK